MELHDDNALVIYTDGSCLPNPRRGGFAFRLVSIDADGHEVTDDYGPPGFLQATNNDMELTACIEALKLVTSPRCPVPKSSYAKVTIFTDSDFVRRGTYSARSVWPTTGWLTADGEPVIHKKLWKDLLRLMDKTGRVEIKWVKGHKSNPHNRAVDKLAKKSAKDAHEVWPHAPSVRRKKSPNKTDPRSVPMEGQEVTIHIISSRSLPGQRSHAYKIEILDEESDSFEVVDDVYAENDRIAMRSGHVYKVRMGDGSNGRWIQEVIEEVGLPEHPPVAKPEASQGHS